MRNLFLLSFILFAIFFNAPAHAADAVSGATPSALASAATPARPRIALVLSGGGARGYAHIGVLKTLEALRIPVDMVIGTSMGAVVGGLYASGLPAEELERRVSATNLGEVAFDRIARSSLPQSLREDEVDYPISVSAGIDDTGKLKLPKGFVRANSFLALLQEWTAPVPSNQSFDKLAIPFRAVATDLETGERVVFDHGSLPLAIRASMAAPGLFSPIEVNGRTLVDGGLTDNLPVDVARDLGADIVIAVDIGTPLKKGGDINSPADVAQQMVGILIGQNVKAQRDSLKPTDILIRPDLGDITFTDFTRAPEAIRDGSAAAEELTARLGSLSLSPEAYAAYRAGHQPKAAGREQAKIDRIEIDSHGRVPAGYIERYLSVKPGDAYDAKKVNQQLDTLATTGYFASVTHEFSEENGENRLRIDAQEKEWGPNFLLFGLGVSTDFNGTGAFVLNIGHRRPWITSSGLEWRNDVKLGTEELGFHTELRQPVLQRFGYYIAPYAEISQRFESYYGALDGIAADNNRPIARIRRIESKAGIDFAAPIGRLGELRVGVGASVINRQTTENVVVFNPTEGLSLASSTIEPEKQTFTRAQFVIDQLDNALFPRAGYYVKAEVEKSFIAGGNYQLAHLSATGATSFGRHSFNATFEGGGSKHAADPFSLGGFRHLAAYGVNRFTGNYLAYGQLTYQYQIAALNGQIVRDLYLGTTGEIGNVTQSASALRTDPLKKSLSVFVGTVTAFGPAYVGFAVAPHGQSSIYLQFGAKF
ncbi:OMP85 family outer membrane protein [Caballeronia choica]|uniref:OMP85 family outer membrane protein n=1 Tax=Caballeronia choica TaxID=326476 RepID=A0A158HK88_9BURK|nr:patatin-like phospholipase family protein [Caballeronia choica]SAL44812.1 OMP85 family outer membrane protein [Caballeronia choica]